MGKNHPKWSYLDLPPLHWKMVFSYLGIPMPQFRRRIRYKVQVAPPWLIALIALFALFLWWGNQATAVLVRLLLLNKGRRFGVR